MRDITWRMGCPVVTLTALAVLGLNASCSPAYQLLEQALGRTPQREIAGYLEATARGDRAAALAFWLQPAPDSSALLGRREAVTDTLISRGPKTQHRVLDVTWWRTCCEPAVIDDPSQAGGARVRVALDSRSEPQAIYTFDLLVPGGYWGDAAGNPLRDWAIVDIYPEGMQPLAWMVKE